VTNVYSKMRLSIAVLAIYCGLPTTASEKHSFWTVQRKGANCFNALPPSEHLFKAAHEQRIAFMRLACDKWPAEKRDFLLGSADHYEGLSCADYAQLREVLDIAYTNGIPVILTFLSLPGSRWSQNNDNIDDLRIWQEERFQEQAIEFWKDLAVAVKDHPAVVAYNILNEPHPERITQSGEYDTINFDEWYKEIENSCADLNRFYQRVCQAIREVDSETSIIVDTGLYATPWAIEYLSPLSGIPHVLYSFHMYEPYGYTTGWLNQGRLSYPGEIPVSCDDNQPQEVVASTPSEYWDIAKIESFFAPVHSWQKRHAIPAHQILVGEFGCNRLMKGAETYLQDVIAVCNEAGWHWAFYEFKADDWDGMDYELGTIPTWRYYEVLEAGGDLEALRTNTYVISRMLNINDRVHNEQSNE